MHRKKKMMTATFLNLFLSLSSLKRLHTFSMVSFNKTGATAKKEGKWIILLLVLMLYIVCKSVIDFHLCPKPENHHDAGNPKIMMNISRPLFQIYWVCAQWPDLITIQCAVYMLFGNVATVAVAHAEGKAWPSSTFRQWTTKTNTFVELPTIERIKHMSFLCEFGIFPVHLFSLRIEY